MCEDLKNYLLIKMYNCLDYSKQSDMEDLSRMSAEYSAYNNVWGFINGIPEKEWDPNQYWDD